MKKADFLKAVKAAKRLETLGFEVVTRKNRFGAHAPCSESGRVEVRDRKDAKSERPIRYRFYADRGSITSSAGAGIMPRKRTYTKRPANELSWYKTKYREETTTLWFPKGDYNAMIDHFVNYILKNRR